MRRKGSRQAKRGVEDVEEETGGLGGGINEAIDLSILSHVCRPVTVFPDLFASSARDGFAEAPLHLHECDRDG